MRILKSQVAKVSTVRVEKIFALAVQHDATVDTFATCGFNVRMRKYASCGPRLISQERINWKECGRGTMFFNKQ